MGISNWELGNEIMCGICDKLFDLENECKASHPDIAAKLKETRINLGPTVNKLMEDTLCPID